MGYSIVTRLDDTHSTLVRYTEWVEYNSTTNKPDWNQLHAVELYNRTADPAENWNQASKIAHIDPRSILSGMLHRGWRGSSTRSAYAA